MSMLQGDDSKTLKQLSMAIGGLVALTVVLIIVANLFF